MENSEIISGNKLIAEFMGKNYMDTDDGERGYLFPLNGHFNRRLTPLFMSYHKSWDWLLEVVKKIEALEIDSNELIGDIFDSFLCIDLERTWQSVIKFITWYNTNNTPNPKQ